MSIQLFEHNQKAYASVLALLHKTGKAAVVHPTGTGKSFIAFKYCEDHPRERVLWISPSEYIFHTQEENLKACGASLPDNITFCTFTRLVMLDDSELEELNPDIIILDEFHRAGAEVWGRAVRKLLDLYNTVPILGLSATHIRYLDNQRNMADELFDGNIASEITLSEAIVRGILTPPKYVLSLFKYRSVLDTFEQRIQRAKSGAVRDKAQQYLEQLRRNLEMSEGLDRVFAKHMTNKTGKYIVFCADEEHIKEMLSFVPEWFFNVDPEPHVYTVYSSNPETSKVFADFKADNSGHLKLLYCIDMLNEGVHVDGVSGVILLRPTVSPIVYKQQIGRALSTGAKNNAVIFDIVMNIENLYSIDCIKEEMDSMVYFYRENDMGDQIVNEHFEVIDEVKDCLELFDRLNDTLTASWDLMYSAAKAYYSEYGNLNVPVHYTTSRGYSLGSWIAIQRRIRAGTCVGSLDETRIAKLDSIGMIWKSRSEVSWENHLRAARDYYAANGNLEIPARYITEDGLLLGHWISNLRCEYNNGRLSQERIKTMEELGLSWDINNTTRNRYYAAAIEYARQHGSLAKCTAPITEEEKKLFAWLDRVRYGTIRLTPAQQEQLTALGLPQESKYEQTWQKCYTALKVFYEQNGHSNLPTGFTGPDGIRMDKWISRQRTNTQLSEEKKQLLDAVGITWSIDPWERKFKLAEAYYHVNGNLKIPDNYVVEGIWLGKWIAEQRLIWAGKRKKHLTEEQIERLTAIGMRW